ncbi:MAG: chromate transporter [bacterium]
MTDEPPAAPPLPSLTRYFLRLGTTGFGGPVALVGHMHRDLVETRRWIAEAEYKLALALAQVMPGPLAAQTAMAIGFFRYGVAGATLAGLAFVLPSFLMVVALAVAYVHYGGLWWMQAAFYGIAAAVIAIIAIGAYRLATKTNRRDPLLWGIALALFAATVYFQAELAVLFVAAGLLVLVLRAPPAWMSRRGGEAAALLPFPLLAWAFTVPDPGTLATLFLFFAKAGAFVFGSGLAIVPFLHAGVVVEHHWLDERTFLDAVAVAIITPGPVVITVAFIGYLVAGPAGALVAALGMFLPVWLFTVLPAPWFRRHQHHPQLRAFVDGATAAATGAIAGAVVILGRGAIVDWPTIAIAVVGLALLLRWRKLPEPAIVLAAGAVGMALFVARAHGWRV